MLVYVLPFPQLYWDIKNQKPSPSLLQYKTRNLGKLIPKIHEILGGTQIWTFLSKGQAVTCQISRAELLEVKE